MTASRRDNEVIFHAARDIPEPDRRREYVREACGGDEARVAHVEALLAAADTPDSLLDHAAVATVDQSPVRERPGDVIGPYKVLEPIGEGGFGLVFLAEQTQPVRRKVALKVLKPGMDTRQVVARFEAERQALAIMDHPNIAKVFDAGETETGRPYFVMELVKGAPITQFCDQGRLTPRERLGLFVSVCQAVQHAHQKGVIHRDLKPSNVLVTMHDARPVVKVIDFGVAKALGQQLTDKTVYTQLNQMVGTPLYMSPEQAGLSGLDVDTRTDIYALGVLLYELLTGTTPFEADRLRAVGFDEMRRIIRDEDPPKPSARISTLGRAADTVSANRQTEPARLTRLVRGELDWVVMKALDKDRNRRYETATGFAADVRRYLADEPVLACPPSVRNRLRKFARRNKTGLTMAAIIILAVSLVFGGLGWMVRDRSFRRAETAQRVRESLARARRWIGEKNLTSARQELAEARGRIGKDSIAFPDVTGELEGLEAELAARAEAQDRFRHFFECIDQAHERETSRGAAVTGRVRTPENRDPREAIPFVLRALALYSVMEQDEWSARLEQEWLEPDQVTRIRHAVYEKLLWLAEDLRNRRQDHLAGADLDPPTSARRALAYLKKAEGMAPPTRALFWIRSRCWEQLGDQRAAKADAQRARAGHIQTATDHFVVGQAAYFEANGAMRAERKAEGIREFEAALRLDPSHYWSLMWLGWCLCDKGEGQERAEAVRVFTGCIALRPRHAHAYYCRAIAFRELGRPDQALPDFDAALALKPDHVLALYNRGCTYMNLRRHDRARADLLLAVRVEPRVDGAWVNLGVTHEMLGEIDLAVSAFTKSIEMNSSFAPAHHHLGMLLCDRKQDYDGAITAFRAAIRLDPTKDAYHDHLGVALSHKGLFKESLAAHQEAVRLNPLQEHAYFGIGLAFSDLGQFDAAIAAYRKAIEVNPGKAKAYGNLGRLLHNYTRDHDGAIAAIRKAIELDPTASCNHLNLGNALQSQKKFAEAIVSYRKAIEIDSIDASVYHNLGICLAVQKEPDEAIGAFKKAIEIDPNHARAHSALGSLQFDYLKDYGKAIKSYREAIKLDPKHASNYCGLGKALAHQEKWDEAIDACRTAFKLESSSADTRDGLAWVLNTLAWSLSTHAEPARRDPARAVRLAREAIEMKPLDRELWNTLGAAQYRAGNWEAAVAALEKSMELSRGGDSFDWFLLAMAHWKLGVKDKAHKLYKRAVEWMDKTLPKNEELRRFRAEAAELLELATMR